MANKTIMMSRIVGGGICVAADDGHKVHDEILTAVKRGDRITISFENVTRVTTAFLNAAIGQLYSEFSEEEVKGFMNAPVGADNSQLTRLKLVVDRAKEYFRNPEPYRKNFAKVTGLDDGDNN